MGVQRDSPAATLAAVLLAEPFVQRREVIANGAGIDVLLAGKVGKNLAPGPGLALLQQGVECLADLLVAVDRTAIERALPAGLAAGRAVELEFVDKGEEIARIRRIARNMEFRSRIEGICRTHGRRRDALVAHAQFPPRIIVTLGQRLS